MKPWAVLSLAILALTPAPVPAQEWYGTPSGRIGLGGGFDDHATGREAPDPAQFPHGNLDGMGRLSVRLGTEYALLDDWGLTVSGRAYGDRYLNYPEFSLAWGNLSAELGRYDLFGFNVYLGGDAGMGWGGGQMSGASLALERLLGGELWLSAGGGIYQYLSPATSTHLGGWANLGLYRQFGALSAWLALSATQRQYAAGTVDLQGDATLGLSYRFDRSWAVRAFLTRLLVGSSDTTRSYGGDQASLGLSYDLF